MRFFPRRADDRLARGQRAEQLARQFLSAQGFVIEQANVRYPVGEIDLVAWDGQTLCFVEVRSTSSQRWGGPLASITDRKRRHLIQAARWHLQRLRQIPRDIRFDVVAVEWKAGDSPRVELVRGAFTADEQAGW